MNHIEYNRDTLKDALARLPKHQPPEGFWGNIENELNREEKELALKNALSRLPSYSPPPTVWEAVKAGLEQKAERPRFGMRRLRWTVAAASIAAMVAWFFFSPSGDPEPQPVFTYEIEQTNLGLFVNDWDTDAEELKAVVEQFSKNPFAEKQGRYDQMMEDWRELEEAKSEVAEIMEMYGKDAMLIRQMIDIEHARSKLAKEMAIAI